MAVAQLVEPRVVVPVVAGSSPVRHPGVGEQCLSAVFAGRRLGAGAIKEVPLKLIAALGVVAIFFAATAGAAAAECFTAVA